MCMKSLLPILIYIQIISIVIISNGCGLKTGNVDTDADIVSLTISEPASLDPNQSYDGYTREILVNLYDSLIENKKGTTDTFVPRVSTNVPSEKEGTIKDDGKTYIFTIKKGITFHNGNPLTAEDVEYSFERNLLQGSMLSSNWLLFDSLFGKSNLRDLFEEYSGLSWDSLFIGDISANKIRVKKDYEKLLVRFYNEIIDPIVSIENDKVIISLNKAFPPFLSLISHYGYNGTIMDKEWCIKAGLWDGKPDTWWHYLGQIGKDSPLYDKAMGSGPYKLEEWDRENKQIILTRYDKYFRGKAQIKKVTIKSVETWSVRKKMFQQNKADIIWVNPEQLEEVRAIEGMKTYENLLSLGLDTGLFTWDIEADSAYIGSGKFDGYGVPGDFFKDKDVRLGFIYAFDYKRFITDVLNNRGFTPPTCLIKGIKGYNESLAAPDFYLEKAALSFKRAHKGQVWRHGFSLIIPFNKGNTTRRLAIEMLDESLKKINPKFSVIPLAMEWSQFYNDFKSQQTPFFIIGWNIDYPDPHNFAYIFYHSEGDCGGNYGKSYKAFAQQKSKKLDNMSLDELIEKAASIHDSEKRSALYAAMQEYVRDEAICMPIFQTKEFAAMRNNIKGWAFNPILDSDFFEYYYLYKTR